MMWATAIHPAVKNSVTLSLTRFVELLSKQKVETVRNRGLSASLVPGATELYMLCEYSWKLHSMSLLGTVSSLPADYKQKNEVN